MEDKAFIRVDELAEVLEVSTHHAYKLIREMNSELKVRGYLTIVGRVSRKYFEERFYGISVKSGENE